MKLLVWLLSELWMLFAAKFWSRVLEGRSDQVDVFVARALLVTLKRKGRASM